MKKRLLFLLLSLLALSTTALAARHTDGAGTVWETDGTGYYAWEAPAPLAAALAEDLTPLGDPSDLRWDPAAPGKALWETKGAFQRKCKIIYYRTDAPDTPAAQTTITFGGLHASASFDNNNFYYHTGEGWTGSSSRQPLLSGDYYFTVQNLGDGVTYGDSAVISSLDTPDGKGVYHYVEPAMDTTLETPAQGHWEWPAAVWEDRQDEDERIKTYYIGYGYSAERLEDLSGLRSIGGSYSSKSGREDSWLQDRLIGEHGAGWYYFRVRPISADIEQWRNGGWSEWSEGYNLAEAAREITDQLNQIDKNASKEDIRRAVQDLGQTELHNALTADILEAGTGASEALAALETALGGPAKASVDETMAGRFDAGGVSVVGAALNNVTGDPVLNIGAPKDSHDVRDENYSSTLAVDFSMDLSGVENPHDLAVPVKVTLPIPEDINPDFLAILHYRAGGSFEEVLHTVFEKDGQWYASFVLSSFSDFTLTETVREEPPVDPPAETHTASVTIDGETAYYDTFAEAWAAATDPDLNIHRADAAITLLKDATDESTGTVFYLNHGQTVTLNLSGHTLTLSSRRFFLDSDTTLILNGAPEGGGDNGKIVLTATDGEPGVVGFYSGREEDAPAYLQVNRCDLESNNGPAIFGGDGNVAISGSTVTAQAVVLDLNRRAAVALAPNPGKETTLTITGSTLAGQCGLAIGGGMTAAVENSTITGTEDDTSGYGVMMDGGTLTVRGNSLIESPVTGVHVTGGRLDFQGGVIRASGSASNHMVSGVTVENNTSDDALPAPEAVLCGTVESEGYGVRAAEGTVKIQDGASVAGKSEGVFLTGGQLLISGGSVTSSGTGLSAWDGSAGISGGAEITGAACGISISENAALTVAGGTVRATGEYGVGLRVQGGSAALSGGTYMGTGSAVETAYDGQILVKDLLAEGFAYYRPDGSVITTAEMDEMQTWFLGIQQVTVQAGDPGGGSPALETGPGGAYEAANVPAGASLVLARYEGGRFQSLEALERLSGTLAGSGKLFLLDEGFRPLCAAKNLRP